jgi:hypothetical protein
VRPLWRGRRWAILGGLAVLAWALGVIGYWLEDGAKRWDVLAYESLQLFALESPAGPVTDPNAALNIARVLAPLVAASAVVTVVASVFREQLQVLGLRFFARDLRVVVGLGTVGFRLVIAMYEEGAKVLAVERDPGNAAITGCRERGIPVVKGDAVDRSVLGRTRLGEARDVYITCGEDGVNLDVVRAVAQLFGENRSLCAHVHLHDLALWRPLQAEVLTTSDSFGFRLEFFNALEAAARVLLDTFPAWSEPAHGPSQRPHVLLVSLDEVGEFALLQLAGRWRNRDRRAHARLQISVVSRTADAQVHDLLERYPELEEICALETEDVDVGSARFQRGDLRCLRRRDLPVTAAYVCLASETAALTAALALSSAPAMAGVPLVVLVQDEQAGVASLLGGTGRLADVAEFGILSRLLVSGAVLGTQEILAQLRHGEYLRSERARGMTEEANPSMVPWGDLPEVLKESNRAFANGIGRKMQESGCTLVPAPLAHANGFPPLFAEDEVEDYARKEHERWRRDLEDRGWELTTGPKDADRKLHPDLVDWNDLGPVQQNRARESIRALPHMLARAGFVIQRVGGDD